MRCWKRLSFVSLLLGIVVSALAGAACGGGGEAADQAQTHQDNASALVDKGDWAGAIKEYSQAVELNPKSDEAYEGRGVAYTELGEYDKAIADLSKAVELRPDRGGPFYGRGVAYRLQGNLDLAIADFSKAIGDRSKTRWRSALYERGLAYKAKGLVAEARADFERIVQLETENPGEGGDDWMGMAQKELAALGT